MTAQQALARFVGELRRVRELAGSPSLHQIVALTTRLGRPLARSTVSDKLNAKSLVDWEFVVSFLAACRAHSERTGGSLPAVATDLTRWATGHHAMLRAIEAANAETRLSDAAAREIGHHYADAVGGSAPPMPPGRAGPTVPRQLPPLQLTFTGRHRELQMLAELVDEATRDPHHPRVVAIDGMPGVGKTAFATYAAHHAARRFPDGQLWIDLQGFAPDGSPTPPVDALGVLLDGLDVPAGQTPAELSARLARYRTVVAGRRLLIVLDNARDSAQVRPLLPGTGGCLVLITGRLRLTGLVTSGGIDLLTLDLPDEDEARELLSRRLAGRRGPIDRITEDEVVVRCARLPLALSIVAARATQPASSLPALANELRTSAGSLDSFDVGDPSCDLRSVFSWPFAQLTEGARTLFHLMASYPGPSVTTRAAASLAGVPTRVAHGLLAELTAANMVTPSTAGGHLVHDLLRAYGAGSTGGPGAPAGGSAAGQRLLDFYLYSAHAATRLLDDHRQPVPLPPLPPGVTAEVPSGYQSALAWLESECRAVLAVIGRASAAGLDPYVWHLTWTLATYLDRQGRWHELADLWRVALAASRRLGDSAAQARSHCGLGRASCMVGRYGDARHHLRAALQRFHAVGDAAGMSCAHVDLALLAERQGRHRAGLVHADRALHLYRQLGHPTGPARTMAVLGRLHGRLGDVPGAVLGCRNAIRLQQETGDRRGEAASWTSLGLLRSRVGQHREAATCHRYAARLSHELGDRHDEAMATIRSRRISSGAAARDDPPGNTSPHPAHRASVTAAPSPFGATGP